MIGSFICFNFMAEFDPIHFLHINICYNKVWMMSKRFLPAYTDPDAHDATWYFQQSYDVATAAIADPGPFGLQKTYYDVNWGPNDRNNKIVLYADHSQTSEKYNGSSLTYGSGGAPDNFAGWMLTWNYPNMKSSGVNAVQRAAKQHLGRPWVRMAPPI